MLPHLLATARSSSAYQRPTAQDLAGRGIWPAAGEADNRSEQIYLPFVLGPRRQTDALVRQAYLLLPAPVRRETAFVLVERLVQYPQAYLPYLESRRQVVFIGNFVGIGNASEPPAARPWYTLRHAQEFAHLEWALQLAASVARPVIDIVYGLGDSPSPLAPQVRQQLQDQLAALLAAHDLAHLARPLGYGGDEAVYKAFARQLPTRAIRVHCANPEARHRYDGFRSTGEIIQATLAEVGLTAVNPQPWDMQVYIFNRRPLPFAAQPEHFFSNWQATDRHQQRRDYQWAERIAALSTSERSRTAIIDARLFNGAWDTLSIPPSDAFLAFGSWGTASNVCAQTLAVAKLLLHNPDALIQRQLLREAVAHDVFANGYVERGRLQQRLGGRFNHYAGYDSAETTAAVFAQLNAHVQERIAAVAPWLGGGFRFVPQLWRTFESAVYADDGPLSIAGVYRTDLPPACFDPYAGPAPVRRFTLGELLAQG